MAFRSAAAAFLIALAGCGRPVEAPPPPGEPQSTQQAAPTEAAPADADIAGRWRIVSLNGAPPRGGGTDADGRRAPHLVFTAGSYGGNTGCNSFGGLGVVAGDRFYGGGAMQTAIGCGDLTAQEDAILRLLRSAPRIALGGDRLTLSDGTRSMVLERQAPPPPADPPAVLAGTRWTLSSIDGRWMGEARLGERILAFEADRWTLSGPCGGRSGTWRQLGDRIEASSGPITTAPCRQEEQAADSAVAELLESRPRFATGPNGEILIGGGGHWIEGERPREPLRDQAALLTGNWRIAGIDGAPPVPGSEPSLSFGSGGYSGTTGCNSIQGLFLAHARRLHTGFTLQTEQGCSGTLGAQEKRITALLGRAPRIALGRDGELALVDREGRLLLRREAAAPASAVPQTRPWQGEPLTAELTILDGEPLRIRYTEPEMRLRLTAQRFDISSGCARLGGIWRGSGDSLEFLTDAERPPEGACGGALVERLPAFMRLGNGPFRALIGRNRELLIAGPDHRLGGEIEAPLPKRR